MARETSSPSVGSGASPGFCFKKVALQPEVAAKKFGSGAFGQLFGSLAITEGASVNSGSETLFVSIGLKKGRSAAYGAIYFCDLIVSVRCSDDGT